MLTVVLFIAASLIGLIAGAMTYFITYNEYQHHFNDKRTFRESIKSGLVAFIFFFVLSLAVAFILYRLFK